MSPALGAEELARRALEALQNNLPFEAAGVAQFMRRQFPSLTESHVLYAKSLAAAGRHQAALDVWRSVVDDNPLQMVWLEQAMRLALFLDDRRTLQRWAALMERVFVQPPSFAWLAELERQGLRVRGSVGIHCNQILGWTFQPSGSPPRVKVYGGPPTPLADSSRVSGGGWDLSRFALDLPEAEDPFFVRIFDSRGDDLPGSPLTCEPPAANGAFATNCGGGVPPAVIVPIYDDRKATLACLASVIGSRRRCRTAFDIIAVWDHGPDSDLLRYLHRLARNRTIQLFSTPRNLGFLGAVNYALRHQDNRDVVLLNSDTIVHGDWLDRMHDIARTLRRVGTITPMGSYAELVSYPSLDNPVEVSGLRATAMLDRACSKAAGLRTWHDLPVGVGFCMYVTRSLLREVGILDGYWLFSGYGEEVDLCLRARKAGFRNLAALNVFVAHFGNRSFGAGKTALAAQNNLALFARYPDYRREYGEFLREDPLGRHRGRISRELYTALDGPLRIMSFLDGESPAVVDERRRSRKSGRHWAALLVQSRGVETAVTLNVRQEFSLADMYFLLPKDMRGLRRALARLSPEGLLVHGFSDPVLNLARRLSLPMELVPAHLPPSLLRRYQDRLPCPVEPFEDFRRIHCFSTELAGWLAAAGLPVVHTGDKKTRARFRCWPAANPPAACLAPAPRNPADWSRLCEIALRHSPEGGVFYVPDLEAFWGRVPRPANIRPCHSPDRFDEFIPARALLFVSEDPETLSRWSCWASERRIPFYLPPEIMEANAKKFPVVSPACPGL